MIGVASMIGGAIFVLVGPGISAAGPALIVAFLLNGIITLFTALTYAELGSALPATGGGYKWVREGLPRPNSYLSGWMAWFAHTIAGSLYAIAFGTFFGHLLKSAEIIDDTFGIPLEKLFAVIAIVIFTIVNIKGFFTYRKSRQCNHFYTIRNHCCFGYSCSCGYDVYESKLAN